MPLLTWKHQTTKDAAKTAVQAELTRLGHGDQFVWTDFEANARVGFGVVLNAKAIITDEDVVIEKCGGTKGTRVLDGCRQMFEKLFPGGNAVPSDAVNVKQETPPEPSPADESAVPTKPTVDELLWKYSRDEWADIAHLDDAELIVYLLNVSNSSFDYIIKQIPDARLLVLSPQLNELITRAKKPSWIRRRLTHSNEEREALLRSAVGEKDRSRRRSRLRRIGGVLLIGFGVAAGVAYWLMNR